MIVKNRHRVRSSQAIGLALWLLTSTAAKPASWDTFADTWVASDALNRSLPTFAEVGPPRPDRTVGMFYFLWLGPHLNGGPWDITSIIAHNPGAMTNKASPPWGPLHAPHH